MKVKCNITTIEAFDKAVDKINEQIVREFCKKNNMSGFIVGSTNIIFATRLRHELFGEKEEER